MENTYTLFWLTGKSEIIKGETPEKAMTLAGYSNGAVRALDFYGNGDIQDQYTWNKNTRNWDKIIDNTDPKDIDIDFMAPDGS